ncbi:MAG: sigma-70 family RNA polymerase sigma factor, partial [Pseudomonadota bacterium]
AASTWIFAIARNRRIDLIRKTARREPDPEDPLFERDPDPDGMVLLSLQERQRIIREAIQELPQDQQDVLRIAFFEGLSHGECAEALDVPLGTVKSRIRLAFRKLREALGEDFVEELLND